MIELPIEHEHSHSDEDHNNETHFDHSYDDDHIPCHPRRVSNLFDYSAIDKKIQEIRKKKQKLKEAARLVKKEIVQPKEIYQTDIIDHAYEESIEGMPEHISMALKKRVKFIEDKIYIGMRSSDDNCQYIARIKDESISVSVNPSIIDELNLMMEEIQVGVEEDIEEGEYHVHNIKRAIKNDYLPKEEPVKRMIIKNRLIKSKLTDLREEFEDTQIMQNSLHASQLNTNKYTIDVDASYFHPNSQHTKKAQEFIKKVQKEQEEIRVKQERKRKEMESLEVKSMMEKRQFQDQLKKEKHQSLKKRYSQERQVKKIEKGRQQKISEDYMKFLSEFKNRKPLFKLKEELFIKEVLNEDEKRRKNILKQIKEAKKSINIEDLLQHQKKYYQIKKQKNDQHEAEKIMRTKQYANKDKKAFFRGKFHSLILEEMQIEPEDPKISRDELLKKKKQYAEKVKKQFFPNMSQAKKKQLEQLIGQIESRRQIKEVAADLYKIQGNRYLTELRTFIADLRKNGKIKHDSTEEEIQIKYIDYLKQMRQKGTSTARTNYDKHTARNMEWVQQKAQRYEKQAVNKEKILKFKDSSDFDLEAHMKEIEEINENYVQSAEAKLAMIRELDGAPPLKAGQQKKRKKYGLTDDEEEQNSKMSSSRRY